MTPVERIIILRFALIPLCLVFLLTGFFGLAAVLFLLLFFWDKIEFYLARKSSFEKETVAGIIIDKILVISILVGLTGMGKASSVAVMVLFSRELLVARFVPRRVHPKSPLGKWEKIIQAAAVVMLMLNLPLAGVILWLSVIFSSITGGAYLWQSNLLKQLRSS